MKILQLLGSGAVGGTERHVVTLVSGLIDRGHEAFMVNTWPQSPTNDLARESGIPFIELPGGYRKLGPRWFRLVWRYLRANRFDLIHTYGLRVSLGLRLMQRWLGVRHHLMGVRGLDRQRTGLQAWLDRKTERRLDCIVCNAQAVADRRTAVVGTPASLIRVIPNGINLTEFHEGFEGPSRTSLGLPDGFLFINVASFRFEKDHDTLLDAVKLAGDELSDAKVILLGRGSLRDRVADGVRQRGLEDRVFLWDHHDDVRPYLAACDAFVLSSFSEGMPRALMEAMAMGVPAVSTTCGGVPEIARDGVTALLVPTKSPEALAKAMTRIVRDESLRKRLGPAAAKHIRENLSRDLMLDRHVQLYQSIVDRDPIARC